MKSNMKGTSISYVAVPRSGYQSNCILLFTKSGTQYRMKLSDLCKLIRKRKTYGVKAGRINGYPYLELK
jgi:hypothetical protein